MHVGLYFGSFNPIHIGHLIIANYVATNTNVEQVWFVVSPQNPFKKSSTLLNEYQRIHLTRLAVEGNPKLNVSDIEFKLPRPSYTVDTLIYLQEKYPMHQFSIVLGSDSYQNLSKWKNGNLLLQKYMFLVYLRPGFEILEPPENVQILHAPLLEISSTLIRNNIEQNKSVKYLVTEQVLMEIEKGGYYKKSALQ